MSGKGSNILPLAATEHRVRRRDAASRTMGSPSEARARVQRGSKAPRRGRATLRSRAPPWEAVIFERGAKENQCGLSHTLSLILLHRLVYREAARARALILPPHRIESERGRKAPEDTSPGVIMVGLGHCCFAITRALTLLRTGAQATHQPHASDTRHTRSAHGREPHAAHPGSWRGCGAARCRRFASCTLRPTR